MKKYFTFIVILFLSSTVGVADNKTVTQNVSQLPAVSRNFISTHFEGVAISHILIEKNWLGITGYDVILTNGIDIEFDRSGEWKEVDANHLSVPFSVIPEVIADYIKTHFEGKEVVKIEKERREYEIKLINGLELTFNRKGTLSDIDD